MKLYMKVTKDEYELPLIVEDSPTRLAERLGLKVNSVTSMISKKRNGYVKVEVEDEEKQVY
jgi:hypothetical protein